MTTLTPEKFKELLLKGQLPKGPITVNGNLNLTNCKGLTALPNNLTVNGNLDLEGCTGLKALPENLSVKGNLDLQGCTGLKSFYKVRVQGTIFFDDSLIARIPHEELIKHLGLSPEIDALIAKRFK